MDPKRKARRSSILKTRNDGGSGDLNIENMGKDSTLSGNLTGFLPKRRVSFCHTNQVKEFENTNSSTEGSLSKTTDFNQTMCDEMNMSVSMLDTSNPPGLDIPQDYNQTRCVENDMSFDGENHVTSGARNRKSTRLSIRKSDQHQQEVEVPPNASFVPLHRLSQSKQFGNKTVCADMNMSVSMLDATRAQGHQDFEKTRFGENDMSFEQILPNPKRRVSFCPTNQVKEKENTGRPLSKTMNANQTMCAEMNMSVSMLDPGNDDVPQYQEDYEKTRFGEKDMSFDQTGVLPKRRCPTNQVNRKSESRKSSNEGALSKTMNSNQTMCPDMNMSVSMLDATKAAHQDYDRTRFEENDMSFDGENLVTRKSTRLSTLIPSQRRLENTDVSVASSSALPFLQNQSKQTANKTMNSNQTMCPDMNMSVSMLDTTKATHQDYDKTRFVEKDMSFDGESHVTRKSTRLSTLIPSQRRLENTDVPVASTSAQPFLQSQSKQSENITMNSNQTVCPDMNMSVSMLDTTKATHQDYDKTRFGEKDMSFDGESRVTRKSTRVSTRKSSEQGQLEALSTEVKDMQLESANAPIVSTVAEPLSQSKAVFKLSECKVKPTVTITNNEERQYHDMSRTTPMVFSQPNPENFSNPFGNGITMKRASRQKEPQLSFGQFGSSKTPKRNRIASIVPPKPQQHQQVIKITNDANIQTSPMVPAPALKKKTQEVGFNCTLGAIDTRKFSDASLMTSPAYFSAPKSQQTTPGERELPKTESVGVGTSMIVTSPAHISAPKSQQTTPGERESPKMESVGVGTSMIMTSTTPPPLNKSSEVEVSSASDRRDSSYQDENASLPFSGASNLGSKSSCSQSTSPQHISGTVELFKVGALEIVPDKRVDLSEESDDGDEVDDNKKALHEEVLQVKSEEKMVVDAGKDEEEEKQNEKLEEMNHSFAKRNGNRESQDMKQTETLRSIAVDNSQYNISLDQSSFRRQSEKTQNGIVEESYFFENTLPIQPTMCAALVPAAPPQIPAKHVIPIDSEDELSFASKPAPTPGFEELFEKLNEFVNMPDLDIFEKWGFLRYAMDKLARIADHEWEDVLSYEKIKGFLGQDYIKAVNTQRKRLSSKEPLYVGARKYAAEMKKKGIPLA